MFLPPSVWIRFSREGFCFFYVIARHKETNISNTTYDILFQKSIKNFYFHILFFCPLRYFCNQKYQKFFFSFVRFGFSSSDLFSKIPKYRNLGIFTKTSSERIVKLTKRKKQKEQAKNELVKKSVVFSINV